MSYPFKILSQSKGSAAGGMSPPVYIQGCEIALSDSTTTTTLTFATESLYDMGNTTYHVQATALGATATPIQCTTRNQASLVLTHGDSANVQCAVVIIGRCKVG